MATSGQTGSPPSRATSRTGRFGGTGCRRCDATPRSCCYRKNRPGISSSHPISPDCSTRSCSPHQPTTPSHRKPHSRGDGLLLLHHGHVLIAKERNTPVPDRIRMRDLAAMVTPAELGAGRHRQITLTRTANQRSMLSSSRSKIHNPRVTGVSRAPGRSGANLSTTRHHGNDVGAARGVAARQGHRRDPADHQRPPARARPPRLRTQRPRTGHCAHTAAPHARRPCPAPPPLGRSPTPYPAAARATRGLELLPSIVPSSASTPNVPNNLVLQALDGR